MVVIVGVISSMIVLSVSSADPERKLARVSQEFVARLQHFCDDAIFTNQMRGIHISNSWELSGMQYVPDRWIALQPIYEIPVEYRMTLRLQDDPWLAEQQGEELPTLWCDGAGEWSPFTATLTLQSQDYPRHEIQIDSLGRVTTSVAQR